ncbi:MAG: nitroreductase/quinone reductase family protein [Candidatus Dormibacteria bacterium]|jgi:deazaflavin-dependent oxidoreductase (nitroreductase family)
MAIADLQQPVRDALSRGGVIDITTTGRTSGQPRRLEIVFHNVGGRLCISGMPGFKRNYIANLAANPHFTFHLKGPVRADLAATARVVTDEAERREVLPHIARIWKRDDIETMVEQSPLFEVTIDGPVAARPAEGG